ncbi:MAG TPA: PAS domain-containing protein [Candidatus Limnocylindria bacterium]|nr:PAS domain-containing protein [Candidatus Limnocylindria bacterium]
MGEGSGSEGTATFVVNHRGRFETVDAGACALLGYSREELLAMHGSELVPEAERPRVAVSLDRMRIGELTEQSGRLMRKDGRVIEVHVEARRLPGERLELRVRAAGGGAGSGAATASGGQV